MLRAITLLVPHPARSNGGRNNFPVSLGTRVAGAESSKPQAANCWGFEDSAPATQLTEVIPAAVASAEAVADEEGARNGAGRSSLRERPIR